ncbi:MAG: pyruvate, phosphate dikinase [Proteobacteria bacterium]|nr:pyruvate, phosphate dikinase [Pseudomonadota bacterium]NCA28400.1 pyruvate, phosphate dikinase [Pseudomonadota bacterium]
MTSKKFVYSFGDGNSEGDASMKNLLGGKGANLAEMSKMGLPVPLGFTITTEVCEVYYKNSKQFPSELKSQVHQALSQIEQKIGSKFGDAQNPLLFSVRSGARASMPGMMDTVLNLGLNDQTVLGLAQKSGNKRFAFDSYRRFIQMYSDVVLGVDHYNFEVILDEKKQEFGATLDTDLTAENLEEIVSLFKQEVKKELGREFPQSVEQQLWGAIEAVFASWMNDRAITYRALNNIPAEWGTAVNVQSMVFGNMGETSATGVAFTRNPSTGAKELYGEYLINAQGEDVVAGIRTPQSITIQGKEQLGLQLPSMQETMPDVFLELEKIYKKLENHYRDMQDIEFTVQNKKLWMLQTRSGKRTAHASVKIAVDMVKEKLITKDEALLRVDPASLDQLLHPTLDPKAKVNVIAKGLPASPGAASGVVVFSSQEAERRAENGDKVILVRVETSPEDIKGMHVSQGILTARGGMTSHAAVVARGMGTPCVSGATGLHVDNSGKFFIADGVKVKDGETITINGSNGEVILGSVPTLKPNLSGDFETIMSWADEVRHLKVRTNAETPADCQVARDFGAEGIGLCRTEHMFFNEDRIIAVREMILAETSEGRKKALAKLLPMQRQDFVEIFKIMSGLPVTIRLLDPPLHEFLPHKDSEIQEVAKVAGVEVDYVKHRTHQLQEQNPMLGHRGCRLGISYPEIYEMQARAIFEAFSEVKKSTNQEVMLEVMIPLVATRKEIQIMRELVVNVGNQVEKEHGVELKYMVGTMIELPRAALVADKIAHEAEFFSFGTNDLTQTTFGLSRDDAGNFLGHYQKAGILERDPFAELDQEGVGELIKIASAKGKETRPEIKLGICGEHGGNPASIEFCHQVGLNYVSCSPYRVPIARLASARAVIKNRR